MRLLNLDLIAYGKFTDYRIDFPEKNGLHVIYGPNEAGKSTCIRALRNLLYGIPANTFDSFYHEGKRLRLGGTLLGPGGKKLTVIRRKGLKSTLADLGGQPIPEDEWQDFLGGIDRDTFVRVFGLNREELVAGGLAILEGRGGVGESLFAAGLGGADLKRVLETLEAEAGELFKPTGSNPRLNAEAKAFKDLKASIRERSLLPKDWEELAGSVSELEERSRQLKDRIILLTAAEDRLKRLQNALPLLVELRDGEQKRADLGEVKILRKEFGTERRQAQIELSQALSEAKNAKKRIEEIDRELDTLVIPGDLLAQEKTVKELGEKLGAILKAQDDLPGVDGQMSEARQAAKTILLGLRPDLDLESAGTLRLTVKQVERIRRLVGEHDRIKVRRQSATEKVRDHERKLTVAEKKLKELPVVRDTSGLERAAVLVRKKGDLEKAYQESRLEVEHFRKDTEAVLKRLPLWSGALEALESLPLPAEGTIGTFEKLFDTFEEDTRKAGDALSETEKRIAEVDGNLRTLKLAGEPPTEADLLAARDHRDRGWSLVRSAWLEGQRDEAAESAFHASLPLEQAFETSFLKTDDLADRMRREAEKVAHKAGLLAERILQEERAVKLSGDLRRLEERREGLEKDWASRWPEAGFIPRSPWEMRDWMSDWKELVRRATELRKLDGKVYKLGEEIEESRKILANGLAGMGEPLPAGDVSLEAILLRVEEQVQASKDLRLKQGELVRTIEEARRSKDQAQEEERKLEEAFARLEKEWSEAVRGLSEDLHMSAATVFLDQCQLLSGKRDEIEKDRSRVEGMKRDIQIFEGRVEDFVARYAPDLSGGRVDQTVRELMDRVSKARVDSASQTKLSAERASRSKELQAAQATFLSRSNLLASLRREAGCGADGDLPETEERSETARKLDDRISELNKQILFLAGGQSLESFFGEMAGEDREQILQELEKVKADLKEATDENDRVGPELVEARVHLKALDGRPDAARAAQEAQERLDSLRDNALRYMRIRLAAKILQSELEKYREKSQGPVLKRAGKLFAPLTRRFFIGLEADYDDDERPVLVGVRENGERVTPSGMSDGTQDQLYLALRLASLEHFMAGGSAMPLLVDDALVNFDDDRARAALKLFEDLANKTQVLFFTHHQHMVELARESIDEGVLHFQELIEKT
jgi:uncharacterized protein YhaN